MAEKYQNTLRKDCQNNISAKWNIEQPSFIEKLIKEKAYDHKSLSNFHDRRVSCPEGEIASSSNPFDELLKQSSTKVKILEEWFTQTQIDLKKQKFDIEFSGTTAVSIIISPRGVVTCANIGDSRAILITERGGMWSNFPLSRDHKPDLYDELDRIGKLGGRVEAYKDENGMDYGPKRVWLK